VWLIAMVIVIGGVGAGVDKIRKFMASGHSQDRAQRSILSTSGSLFSSSVSSTQPSGSYVCNGDLYTFSRSSVNGPFGGTPVELPFRMNGRNVAVQFNKTTWMAPFTYESGRLSMVVLTSLEECTPTHTNVT
jgi:hypothetical protein